MTSTSTQLGPVISKINPDADASSSASPFLKWAGSKRKLLRHIVPLIPSSFERYYEPFLGGGALFFHLAPRRAVISDISKELIETYSAIRDDVNTVIKYLQPLKPNKKIFYSIRSSSPRGRHQRAAYFIFLNKTCWNGLYRVNTDGIFNVPFGQLKTKTVFNADNLRACSRVLQRNTISLKPSDFEKSLSSASNGDFVYLDPPYVTTHNRNGFLEWNETIFSWNDQIRLAKIAHALVKKKVNVLISNAAHREVKALYEGFKSRPIKRMSTLASDPMFRIQVNESLFFAGPNYE